MIYLYEKYVSAGRSKKKVLSIKDSDTRKATQNVTLNTCEAISIDSDMHISILKTLLLPSVRVRAEGSVDGEGPTPDYKVR